MEQIESFEQFANAMTRALHDALLQEGSRGMHRTLFSWLPYFEKWIEDFRKKEREKAKQGGKAE